MSIPLECLMNHSISRVVISMKVSNNISIFKADILKDDSTSVIMEDEKIESKISTFTHF